MLLALAAALVFGPAQSQAGVLTFEGLTTSTMFPSIQSVAPGYGGFNWSSEFLLIQKNENPGSGYEVGTVGTYSAFNGQGHPVSMTSASTFNFEGAFLTAAWNSGLSIQVQGWLNGSLLYTSTITTNPFTLNWFNFNYTGINELTFTSFGGTNESLGGSGTHFSLENFTYNHCAEPVPEPATLLLLGGGLTGLALRRRRRA